MKVVISILMLLCLFATCRARGQARATPASPPSSWGPAAKQTNVNDLLFSYGMTTHPFNVKPDGTTDNSATLQAAIDASIAAGHTLILPPGNILLNSTLRLCAKTTPVPNYYPCVKMRGSNYGNDINATILTYTGKGIALDAGPPGCIFAQQTNATSYGANIQLDNFQLVLSNPGGTATGFHLCNVTQGMFRQVVVEVGGGGDAMYGFAMTNYGGNGTFDWVACGGSGGQPGSGIIHDCFYFTGPNTGIVFIDKSAVFSAENGITFDNVVASHIVVSNTFFEFLNRAILVTDRNISGLGKPTGVTLNGLYFHHNRLNLGLARTENALLYLENDKAADPPVQLWATDVILSENSVVCAASACYANEATSGGSDLQRTGNVVTVVPAGGNVFVANEWIYKQTPAAEVRGAFPGGWKQVVTAGNLTSPGKLPCVASGGKGAGCFTYKETSVCAGSGACASGCPGACKSTQASQFESGGYAIAHASRNGTRNVASSFDIRLLNNSFSGFERGLFVARSLDAQSSCTSCSVLSIQAEGNTMWNHSSVPVTRNPLVPDGSSASVWTEPDPTSLANLKRINVSAFPPTSLAVSASDIFRHQRGSVKLTSGRPSTATVNLLDSQARCVCRDLTNPATTCTAAAPSATSISMSVATAGTPYPGNQGVLTLRGPNSITDTIEYDCY